MNRLKELTNDPRFIKLSPEEQRKVVSTLEPRTAQLNPEDYSRFMTSIQPKSPSYSNTAKAVIPYVANEFIGKPVTNFLPSAGKNAMEIGKALTVELPSTISGAAKLAAGTIQKALPDEVEGIIPGDLKKYPDAVIEHMKGRWGSVENAVKTIQEDPAGAILDASLLLPILNVGKAGRLGKVAETVSIAEKGALGKLGTAVGNKFLRTPTVDLAQSRKFGAKTAGEEVISRPLGLTKEDIVVNSEKIIDRLEDQIQSRIAEATSKARQRSTGQTDVVGTPRLEYKPGATTKIERPSGVTEDIPRFSESSDKVPPDVSRVGGGSMIYNPEELNMITAGKKPGLFNPNDPITMAKEATNTKLAQKEYIDILRDMKKRTDALPKSGFKTNNPLTITRNEIVSSLDDLSRDVAKSPTSETELAKIKEIKDEFVRNAPDVAGVDDWNVIKRALHKKVGNKNYVKETPTIKVQAEQSLASAIRKRLEDILPDIGELNHEQGVHLKIRDLVNKASDAEQRSVLKALIGDLTDAASILAGKSAYKLNRVGKVLPPARTLNVPRFIPREE